MPSKGRRVRLCSRTTGRHCCRCGDIHSDGDSRASGEEQSGRLVRFLAGLYNGYDYPFDLSDLRPLDTSLANARLDYLSYDRLAVCDLDKHLECGGRELRA
jgi:hypothetical protein